MNKKDYAIAAVSISVIAVIVAAMSFSSGSYYPPGGIYKADLDRLMVNATDVGGHGERIRALQNNTAQTENILQILYCGFYYDEDFVWMTGVKCITAHDAEVLVNASAYSSPIYTANSNFTSYGGLNAGNWSLMFTMKEYTGVTIKGVFQKGNIAAYISVQSTNSSSFAFVRQWALKQDAKMTLVEKNAY